MKPVRLGKVSKQFFSNNYGILANFLLHPGMGMTERVSATSNPSSLLSVWILKLRFLSVCLLTNHFDRGHAPAVHDVLARDLLHVELPLVQFRFVYVPGHVRHVQMALHHLKYVKSISKTNKICSNSEKTILNFEWQLLVEVKWVKWIIETCNQKMTNCFKKIML